MGSSGAGKTTLLNALNFQQESNTIVKGFRYLNGRLATSKRDVIRSSAYVEQDTLFLGTLTVQEHLIFQALVRMDRNMSYRFKIERVEEVIQEVSKNFTSCDCQIMFFLSKVNQVIVLKMS